MSLYRVAVAFVVVFPVNITQLYFVEKISYSFNESDFMHWKKPGRYAHNCIFFKLIKNLNLNKISTIQATYT